MTSPDTAPVEAPPAPSRAARWKWLARLALGLLIVGLLVARGGGVEVRRALAAVSWPVLAASVLFYWAGQTLSATRWRLLLQARGAHLSFWECCRLYLAGMFWNLWMPTSIGGDAVRAYLAAPSCGGVPQAAASILVERLTGFTALLLIGAVGLIFNAAGDQALRLVVALAAALVGVCIVLLAARAVALRLEHRGGAGLAGKLLAKWAALHRALDFYLEPQHRGALAAAVGLSLVFQSSQILLNIFLARAVGLDVPAPIFWSVVPLLAIASMLPVGIGGLGVREAAAVALLGNFVGGVNAGTAVAWSLLWQATVWLASLPGALIGTTSRREGAGD